MHMPGRGNPGGGGHSHWKEVWGCAAVMTPFFQASRRSLAHQFTLNTPLLCPLFSIFRKFLHFQPCFGQNSSSLDPNFSKFSFSRPPFFQENPLPRPYIFKPLWHTPTKKKLSAPPPGGKSGMLLYTCVTTKTCVNGYFFHNRACHMHDAFRGTKSIIFGDKG